MRVCTSRCRARLLVGIMISCILFISFKIIEPELPRPPTPDELAKKMELEAEAEKMEQRKNMVKELLSKLRLDWEYKLSVSPWKLAASWVTMRRVHAEDTPEIGAVLREMWNREIISADFGIRGTQLKMTLVLRGGQTVIFKPKWYERNDVITGLSYSGADRHNAEIAAFHLNRLLGFHRTPLAVGRVVDLKSEIWPVATARLKKTFFSRGENTCFYGKCYYCHNETDGVCASGTKLEGTVVLWLPAHLQLAKWKHPWARTYKANVTARWEKDKFYCDSVRRTPPYNAGYALGDLLDANVLDYLIGNADRHHYETFKQDNNSMIILLDNAKGFGDPYHEDESILTPLLQCCSLRRSTWHRLAQLEGGVLSRVLSVLLRDDPIAPVLTEQHLAALDRRLNKLLVHIQSCMTKGRFSFLDEFTNR